LSSAQSSAFIPAVDDGWAVLSQPPGTRDLVLADYWRHSLERSRRRRAARRSFVAERGGLRLGVALAALAFGGSVTAVSGADDAAAQTATASLDLARGSSGPAVVALQQKLGITADGVFGPQTERAVKRFQRSHGIAAIGRVGPQTTAALQLQVPSTSAQRISTVKQAGPAAVSLSSDAARAMQAKLGVSADGMVGPQTRAALKRYEASKGLPADGQPDAQVLASLGVDPSATAAPAPEAPAVGQGAIAAMNVALGLVGTPYASGGTTPRGFDCSGLTMYAFKQAGITLPRTSYGQYGVGTPVSRSQIQAGDLVFFSTNGGGASHVGIATGPDSVVSATSHGVRQHGISDSYWGSHYVGARRV
jgi:peptidoglycan DL-endopeptidase CwlO